MVGHIDLALVWAGILYQEVTRSDPGMALFVGRLFHLEGAEGGQAEEGCRQGR
jgi:hypothetical protein